MRIIHSYIEIAKLIAKDINQSISTEEMEQISNWLCESEENKDIYREIKSDSWFLNQIEKTGPYDNSNAWNKFEKKIEKKARTRKLSFNLMKIAAVLILLFSISIVVKQYLLPDNENIAKIEKPLIKPGTKGAKLTLDDGKQLSLTAENSFSLQEKDGTKINKEKSSINYTEIEVSEEEEKEIFNTVETAKGQEFSLILSDSTRVFLNSESKMRFPVRFVKNERIIELSGEAYFEVTKNNEKPFKVLTERSTIEVLGTSFNVKSYDNEPFENTTLVEGSVSIQHSDNELYAVKLKPGEQASISDASELIEVREVDTGLFTAWKEGRFLFRNSRMEDIIRDLQRWYDFEVEFGDSAAKEVLFGAHINRYDEVNSIFNIMNETNLIDIYQNGNKFTIRMKNE